MWNGPPVRIARYGPTTTRGVTVQHAPTNRAGFVASTSTSGDHLEIARLGAGASLTPHTAQLSHSSAYSARYGADRVLSHYAAGAALCSSGVRLGFCGGNCIGTEHGVRNRPLLAANLPSTYLLGRTCARGSHAPRSEKLQRRRQRTIQNNWASVR